jgi:hypothetical protein
MVKLFDVIEVVKNLKDNGCARRCNWPQDHYIDLIGDMFLYHSPIFTTEFKFGFNDFSATWESYEPVE